MRRFGWCVLTSAMCLFFSGCAMMHEFRPHRMWRFNRGPAPSTNPFFSVSDPISQLGESGDFPESVTLSVDPAGESLAVQ